MTINKYLIATPLTDPERKLGMMYIYPEIVPEKSREAAIELYGVKDKISKRGGVVMAEEYSNGEFKFLVRNIPIKWIKWLLGVERVNDILVTLKRFTQ